MHNSIDAISFVQHDKAVASQGSSSPHRFALLYLTISFRSEGFFSHECNGRSVITGDLRNETLEGNAQDEVSGGSMPSESTLTAQPQLNLTNETSSVPAALASSSPTPSKKLTAVREALVQADVSWHDFAYLQRATDLAYLCNSVMILETIHRLGCRADRLLLYPKQWDVESEESDEGRLLRQARDTYGVKLKPIEVHTKFASDRKSAWPFSSKGSTG